VKASKNDENRPLSAFGAVILGREESPSTFNIWVQLGCNRTSLSLLRPLNRAIRAVLWLLTCAADSVRFLDIRDMRFAVLPANAKPDLRSPKVGS